MATLTPFPLSDDPPWSSETGPATGPLDETRPTLATSHNATHIVFYQEEKGADTDLAYARSSQGGAWSGANFTDPASKLQRPSVAAGDDLHAWAVAEDASNRSRIALLRSSDDGKTWMSFWLDPSAGPLKFSNICCAAVAAFTHQQWGDGVAVAFEADQQGQANRTVAVAVTVDGGATWSVQSYPGAPRRSPSIAAARDSSTWLLLGAEETGADLNSIVLRLAVPSLAGTVQAFDTGAGVNDAHSSVAADDAGVLWAFHSGSGANYDVKVRVSTDAGATYGAPVVLASSLSNESAPCAALGGRTGLVAWANAQSWTASISQDGGAAWGAAARIPSTANTLASPERSTGCAASGPPASVWMDNRNSGASKLDVLFSNASDTVPPRVSMTIPRAGATGANTADPVSILFSEPMDAASVQAGFKITPAAPGNFSWTGMGLVHFSPDTPLTPNTKYVVNLTGGKDRAGLLASAHEFNFTTGAGDTTKPTVQITAPANNSQVSGIVRITASVTDDVKVKRAEFLVDGTLKTTLAAPPWQYDWDTGSAAAGAHTITVKGTDTSGNQASASITVTKTGGSDTQPPQVDLAWPKDGANLNGSVRARINATDNVAVAYVTFSVGPVQRANLSTAPYDFDWDTKLDANGAHVVYAKAFDTSGNSKEAKANVWIQNGGGSPPVIAHLPVKSARANRDLVIVANITDPDGAKVASAWVKFRVGGGAQRELLMGPVGTDRFEGRIPGTLVTADVEYFLEAEDNQQLKGREPPAQNTYHKVVVDTKPDDPPKISHNLPGDIRAGAELTLKATVTDEFGVAGAWVRFREAGKSEFAQVEMRRSGGEYEATVPGRFLNPPGLEYYVVAEDDSAQVATHPSDAPTQLHKVNVYPTADPLDALEMRLGGVLPLWIVLLVVLLVIAVAMSGAAASARKQMKAAQKQVPWAAGAAAAPPKEEKQGKKGKKGKETEPPPLQPSVPEEMMGGPPQMQPAPEQYQQPGTGIAPISRPSDSLTGPEAEWGFPMGPAAAPVDTEPSLLSPEKRCPRCGAGNKPEAQWCRQCGSSMAAVPR
jgi:hypothetical protein